MVRAPIRLYWWNESPNFGDSLSPLLIDRLFSRRSVWSALEEAELTACGSLLQWITPIQANRAAELAVWGSGFIFPNEPPPALTKVHYYAVRGAQSAAFAGLTHTSVPLGDPGLLASRVVPKSPAKYAVGLVPHLWHRDNNEFRRLAVEFEGSLLIDVTRDPQKLLEEISSCELIVSSSLHGLVVADSYGIPNAWVSASPDSFGGRYKFDDYYSAFSASQRAPMTLDATTKPLDIKEAARLCCDASELQSLQDELISSFPEHLR